MPEVIMSEKGWVVIPAEIRRNNKLKPGDHFRVVEYGGSITFRKVQKNPVDEAFGLLKRMGGRKTGSLTKALEREHAAERRRDEKRLRAWRKH